MSRITLLLAASLLAFAVPAVAQERTYSERPWHLNLNLWGAGIDGSVGTSDVLIDVSSDTFDDTGIFGTLTWHDPDGSIGFIGSLYVMDTNPVGMIRTPGGPVPTSMDVDNSILEAAFSWNLGKPESRFELFGGVRHWDLDAKSVSPVAGTVSFGDSWSDLLVGANFAPRLGENWWLDLKLDYSGGETNGVWGAWVALTWAFSGRAAATLGLKYLNGDLETSKGPNSFSGDIELFGPALGVEFAF